MCQIVFVPVVSIGEEGGREKKKNYIIKFRLGIAVGKSERDKKVYFNGMLEKTREKESPRATVAITVFGKTIKMKVNYHNLTTNA